MQHLIFSVLCCVCESERYRRTEKTRALFRFCLDRIDTREKERAGYYNLAAPKVTKLFMDEKY